MLLEPQRTDQPKVHQVENKNIYRGERQAGTHKDEKTINIFFPALYNVFVIIAERFDAFRPHLVTTQSRREGIGILREVLRKHEYLQTHLEICLLTARAT